MLRNGAFGEKGQKLHFQLWVVTIMSYNTMDVPKNVPQKNGVILTPTRGEARLMNQFGRNGVILKNNMYQNMSCACVSTCALQAESL